MADEANLVHSLPKVVELDSADRSEVAAWAGDHRPSIIGHLHVSGAVLIRGAAISKPDEFRAVAAAICPDLRNYVGGDSPRTDLAEQVYTSTEYPAHLEVLLHNELSYAGWSPTSCSSAAWCRPSRAVRLRLPTVGSRASGDR